MLSIISKRSHRSREDGTRTNGVSVLLIFADIKGGKGMRGGGLFDATGDFWASSFVLTARSDI